MENNNKNKQFIISLICIALLILFSVGIVYAFFNYTRTGERNHVLNTASLNFSFEDSEWIWLENAYPMTTQEGLTLETTGNESQTSVDGGLAQFKVTGGHSVGVINYRLSLIKEDLTEATTSEHGTYTLDPSTKLGQLPDGAVSINLQSSTQDIFDLAGLVNDTLQLENPGINFVPAYTGSYVNTEDSVSIDKLPVGGQNERIIGTGTTSGDVKTRYFELRMWINDSVLMNDEMRIACLENNSDEVTNGRGYCNPTTPNLPANIKYVYSTGEFAKLYYSNKIKIQTTDIDSGVVESVPPALQSIQLSETPIVDNTFTDLYDNVSTSSDSGLLKMESTAYDPYPVYYYRGDVDNNHLIFGGFCWRIVRTTETGGTKIIYDGVPSNGVCNNEGVNTQLSTIAFNTNNSSYTSSIYNVGYKYDGTSSTFDFRQRTVTTMRSESSELIYGKSISLYRSKWEIRNIKLIGRTAWNNMSTIFTYLRDFHYTCWRNTTGGEICESNNGAAYFIYYGTNSVINYVEIKVAPNKRIDGILDLLLSGGNNGKLSTINETLNTWFSSNLTSYTNYLEDTVFCNDRSVYTEGGWNERGDIREPLKFSGYERLQANSSPSLKCKNDGDKFTTNSLNGNASLSYPVGLLTADEVALAGGKYGTENESYYLNNGSIQWTMTPSYFRGFDTMMYVIGSDGSIAVQDTKIPNAVRPVVSLSKNVKITNGDGSSNSPYKVGLE